MRNLKLGIKTSKLNLIGDVIHLITTYLVIDTESQVELESFPLSTPVGNPNDLEKSRRKLDDLALSHLAMLKGLYEERGSLGGLDLRLIDRALNDWKVIPLDGSWKLEHPLSGSFESVLPVDDRGLPKIEGRVRRILERFLPPPDWAIFSSPDVGKLRYRCAEVQGALTYGIFAYLGNGTYQKLGESSGTDTTLIVDPGTFLVGVAGIDSVNTVGLLSQFSSVVVPSQSVSQALKLEREGFPKKTFVQRVKERFR